MGTNYAHIIVYLYCYERDFMSYLHKSKRFDLINMFNDTSNSRYFDVILWTIDDPELEKDSVDIYQAERQLSKANTSD